MNTYVSPYYFYSIPIALIIALIFLNYLAMTFAKTARRALAKMEEAMAAEHELYPWYRLLLAHSLGTPYLRLK